jgi:hypothetical protein
MLAATVCSTLCVIILIQVMDDVDAIQKLSVTQELTTRFRPTVIEPINKRPSRIQRSLSKRQQITNAFISFLDYLTVLCIGID